jgi:hypothetical protein
MLRFQTILMVKLMETVKAVSGALFCHHSSEFKPGAMGGTCIFKNGFNHFLSVFKHL